MPAWLVVVLTLTAVVWVAPLAHAEPDTSQVNSFIAELNKRGADYSTREAVVNAGELICTELRDGQSVAAVISAVKSGGFSSRDTGILMGASAGAFCPDQLPTLQRFIDNNS